ncbi:hypothetical protein EPA93_26990 [Ktedonosporobacter rubrisoli]|uniref:Uncharacterized protein n=1 Tax=Ktedonosporobacter rubrisoli TaxID=2509675 RepID=A0A4P6JV91_KTERU|nr:hypothetical protein [Ktedonosporobacter rubrisoli]QBD79434.1 hypothetical protein EPA93_26990 [Ktedonosporobacter rubrisoli]
MGMNMGIYDWIQKHKDQQAPPEVQQVFANSDAPGKLTQAQEQAKNGNLTIGDAVGAYQTADQIKAETEKKLNDFFGDEPPNFGSGSEPKLGFSGTFHWNDGVSGSRG